MISRETKKSVPQGLKAKGFCWVHVRAQARTYQPKGGGTGVNDRDQDRGRKRGRGIYDPEAGGCDLWVKPVRPAPWLLRHLPETVAHENAKHRTGSCSTCSPASHQARERRSPHKTPSTYLRRFPYWPFKLKFFAHPSCVVRALFVARMISVSFVQTAVLR
jgi:hypothetical protein